MNHFYVWHIKRIKQLIIIMIAAFATASFFMCKTCSLFRVFYRRRDKAVYRGDSDTNEVALTFNISWGDQKAMPIFRHIKSKRY